MATDRNDNKPAEESKVFLFGVAPPEPHPQPTPEEEARYAKLRAPFKAIEPWHEIGGDLRILGDVRKGLDAMYDDLTYHDLRATIQAAQEALRLLIDSVADAHREAWWTIRNEIEPLQDREQGGAS